MSNCKNKLAHSKTWPFGDNKFEAPCLPDILVVQVYKEPKEEEPNNALTLGGFTLTLNLIILTFT